MHFSTNLLPRWGIQYCIPKDFNAGQYKIKTIINKFQRHSSVLRVHPWANPFIRAYSCNSWLSYLSVLLCVHLPKYRDKLWLTYYSFVFIRVLSEAEVFVATISSVPCVALKHSGTKTQRHKGINISYIVIPRAFVSQCLGGSKKQ